MLPDGSITTISFAVSSDTEIDEKIEQVFEKLLILFSGETDKLTCCWDSKQISKFSKSAIYRMEHDMPDLPIEKRFYFSLGCDSHYVNISARWMVFDSQKRPLMQSDKSISVYSFQFK